MLCSYQTFFCCIYLYQLPTIGKSLRSHAVISGQSLAPISEWVAGWRAVKINSTSRGDDCFLDDIISERSVLITPEIVDSSWYGNVPTRARNAVIVVGLGGLCWHNFEHNRYQKALSTYAGIIGTFEHNVCERGRLVLVDSRVQTQTAIHDCTEVHITSHDPPAGPMHAWGRSFQNFLWCCSSMVDKLPCCFVYFSVQCK